MSHFLPLKLRLALSRKGFFQTGEGLHLGGSCIPFLQCKELYQIPLVDVPLFLASESTSDKRLTCLFYSVEQFENAIKPFLMARIEVGV